MTNIPPLSFFILPENVESIMYFVRDYANPSIEDTYFPFAREKDVYLGHSWASGIGGGTRTQESSSEVSVGKLHIGQGELLPG